MGPRGVGWGIDLQAIQAGLPDNVHALQGDAQSPIEAGVPEGLMFDVITSDMMPNTTGSRDTDHFRSIGVCQMALDLCPVWLRPGGHVVMKVLEGSATPQLLADVRDRFDKARPFKPEASRRESTEIFIIGHGYRGPQAGDVREGPSTAGGPPPVPEGW